MDFDSRQIPQEAADCLVIGSGVAGLTAAYHVARAGRSVILAVKETLFDSNTNQAQGGIAVSFGHNDSLELHFKDTLVAGAGLCDEEIVKLVVEQGKKEVEELIRLGAVFDADEQGLCLGREGCHSVHRVVHAKGDATGAEVARALAAAVKAQPGIRILERHYAVDLLTDHGVCKGALFMEDGDRCKIIRAGAVVLATGGVGRLYRHTTNPEGATADGIAMAYRAGAQVMDMEFVQFHPTALALDHAPNFLISEAVRGAGGILLNARGKRFMPEYHAMAELAPRDVVARAIYREIQVSGQVVLDVSGIQKVEQRFPTITSTCLSYGLDLKRDKIPVAPAAHYMMGGVRVNQFGESYVRRLFCCGEVACTGLHGANRLASNSLLEGLAFGRQVAKAVVKHHAPIDKSSVWQFAGEAAKKHACPSAEKTDLQDVMTKYLGLIRSTQGLAQAQSFFTGKNLSLAKQTLRTVEEIEYLNMLTAAGLICLAATMRCESRGAHYRSDFSQSSPFWQWHVIQQK